MTKAFRAGYMYKFAGGDFPTGAGDAAILAKTKANPATPGSYSAPAPVPAAAPAPAAAPTAQTAPTTTPTPAPTTVRDVAELKKQTAALEKIRLEQKKLDNPDQVQAATAAATPAPAAVAQPAPAAQPAPGVSPTGGPVGGSPATMMSDKAQEWGAGVRNWLQGLAQ